VVTGANKGIGLGIVQRLLDETKDIYVFLGSRSLERGEAGLKKIVKNDTKSRVSVLQLDVSDENSIKKAAEAVKVPSEKRIQYTRVHSITYLIRRSWEALRSMPSSTTLGLPLATSLPVEIKSRSSLQ